ncbi:fluoride efflux transporter FluC [Chryseomicrobium palamuruense]|uniref:Fluoride-specific ion channel FluC n=1 Tax=Chryseomicrobium palamuruense TaxID=682973 RepID=A0ABV8UXY8_9BACL
MVLVALGGGCGAILRYLLSRWNVTFPFGTLTANVLAALCIGFLIPYLKEGNVFAFFVTGICGSLGTVSTFALEAVTTNYSIRYMLITWLLTCAAVYIGHQLNS